LRGGSTTNYDQRLTRYLLGQMGDPERDRFEAEYFADDDLFGLLRECEAWLIDEYLLGHLPAEERAQFEQQFSASALSRGEVRLSKALRQLGEKETPHRSQVTSAGRGAWIKRRFLFFSEIAPWPRWAPVIVGLVILAVCGWLVVGNFELRRTVEQLEASQRALRSNEAGLHDQVNARDRENDELGKKLDEEKARADVLQNELAKAQEQTNGTLGKIATLILYPVRVRSSGSQQVLKVDARTVQVRLELNLEPDDYVSYQAELRDSDDRVIWQKSGIKAQALSNHKQIALIVPATVLKSQNYTLLLNGLKAAGGIEDAAQYQFGVAIK
jgi:hypothetical protein